MLKSTGWDGSAPFALEVDAISTPLVVGLTSNNEERFEEAGSRTSVERVSKFSAEIERSRSHIM